MKIKKLSIVLAVAVFGTITIFYVQQSDLMNNVETFTNYNIEDAEELGVRIVSDCWKQSSTFEDHKICFNEKINQLESQFPSIKSELEELGFVIDNKS